MAFRIVEFDKAGEPKSDVAVVYPKTLVISVIQAIATATNKRSYGIRDSDGFSYAITPDGKLKKLRLDQQGPVSI